MAIIHRFFFAQSIVVLFGVTTNTIYSEFFRLREMYKDTNCWSELKPVFIYTGIHMVTSCSNVQICISLTKETLCFYTLCSCTFQHRYDSLVIPAIRIQ